MNLLSLTNNFCIIGVHASPIQRDAARMVPMNLFHRTNTSTADDKSRDIVATLYDQKSWYGISLDIGTPPQPVYLQVDTGSSDLWVGSNAFSPQSSSSFMANSTDPFSIKYGDGSGASGYYAQDTISIPEMSGMTVKDANFGYAENVNADPQVCGIGMQANEATSYKYSNFPIQLKEQGLISALVYSMRLRSSSASGQLLFGGVDHSQYEGQLTTIPLVNSGSFTVELSGIYMNQKAVVTQPVSALLDSGTTNIVLPASVADSLVGSIQPIPNFSSNSNYYVDCASITDSLTFEFDFSGARITVPGKSLVSSSDLLPNGVVPTTGSCRLAVQSGPKAILGDSFLSTVYVVYDLEHLEVSIANVAGINSPQGSTPSNANKDINGDSLMEAVDVDGVIPGAVKAPNFSKPDTLTVDTSAQATITQSSTVSLSSSTATVVSSHYRNAGSSSNAGNSGMLMALLNIMLFV